MAHALRGSAAAGTGRAGSRAAALPAAPAYPPIRVVGDISYPPNLYLDGEGRPAGFDVEVLRLLEQRTGRAAGGPADAPAAALLARLRDGQADVLVGINRTPEREREFDFSSPILENAAVILVHQDTFTIRTADDPDGRRVGVQRNGASAEFSAGNARLPTCTSSTTWTKRWTSS